jgi:hypothetical protein
LVLGQYTFGGPQAVTVVGNDGCVDGRWWRKPCTGRTLLGVDDVAEAVSPGPANGSQRPVVGFAVRVDTGVGAARFLGHGE